MKQSLSPREIPRPPPSGFPSCSGYISPYIPPLVIIQIQYLQKPQIYEAFNVIDHFISAKQGLIINSFCKIRSVKNSSLNLSIFNKQLLFWQYTGVQQNIPNGRVTKIAMGTWLECFYVVGLKEKYFPLFPLCLLTPFNNRNIFKLLYLNVLRK